MDKAELEDLIGLGLSQRQIAKKVGKSHGSVKYWLAKYELSTLPRPKMGASYPLSVVGYLGRKPSLDCQKHGNVEFYLETSKGCQRYRCKPCNTERVYKRKRRLKLKLLKERGSRCSSCGYDKCPEALEFHHVDKDSKKFNLSQMTSFSKELVISEAEKCIVLCSNCHKELEAKERGMGGW